jgi:hypothetical protein
MFQRIQLTTRRHHRGPFHCARRVSIKWPIATFSIQPQFTGSINVPASHHPLDISPTGNCGILPPHVVRKASFHPCGCSLMGQAFFTLHHVRRVRVKLSPDIMSQTNSQSCEGERYYVPVNVLVSRIPVRSISSQGHGLPWLRGGTHTVPLHTASRWSVSFFCLSFFSFLNITY